MKTALLILALLLPVLLCSCATSRPPQTFHNTDNSELVVESLNERSAQIVAPTASAKMDNPLVLDQIKSYARYQTAVVILEDYSEPQLGPQFRDRSMAWFLGLRGLGYQHIVFLQGKGVADPSGLPVLAEYF
jgi:hypothetical protein